MESGERLHASRMEDGSSADAAFWINPGSQHELGHMVQSVRGTYCCGEMYTWVRKVLRTLTTSSFRNTTWSYNKQLVGTKDAVNEGLRKYEEKVAYNKIKQMGLIKGLMERNSG